MISSGSGITFFQITTMIIIVIISIINIRWFIREKNRRYIAILMLSWMAHNFIFYLVLMLLKFNIITTGIFTVANFTSWSSVLRWHSITTIFTIEVGKILYRKLSKN